MFSSLIQQQLQEAVPQLPLMFCEQRLDYDIDALINMSLPHSRLAVIDDSATAEAYGNLVTRAVTDAMHITLNATPLADDRTVAWLREKTRHADALIAVGSGTINDLCKYAAFLDQKPYAVFPTACSMNGYVSANASITVKGHKKTLEAAMPKAVYCDLRLLSAAPKRLNSSGLGDLLARPTAQADWLMSHTMLGTPYDDRPFSLLLPLESALFEQARGIAQGDITTTRLLLESLLLSGFGMVIAKGSYPASQGEHMIAHTLHMLHDHKKTALPRTFHGEEIGITSITMGKRQQTLLRRFPRLQDNRVDSTSIAMLFGSDVAKESFQAFAEKQELIETRLKGHTIPRDRWEKAASQIEAVIIAPERLQAILEQAGAPYAIEALGYMQEDYDTACAYARYLRNRFTFLDLQ